jgi:hypothetical protein
MADVIKTTNIENLSFGYVTGIGVAWEFSVDLLPPFNYFFFS